MIYWKQILNKIWIRAAQKGQNCKELGRCIQKDQKNKNTSIKKAKKNYITNSFSKIDV